jgi:hypothetical protein
MSGRRNGRGAVLRWAGLAALLVGACRAKSAPSQPSAASTSLPPTAAGVASARADGAPPPTAAGAAIALADAGPPPTAAGVASARLDAGASARAAAALQASPSNLFRLVNAHGEHARERIAGVGERLTTGHDGEVVLDLRAGARLRLAADSSLWVLEAVPGAVLALTGGVYATLLPEGNRVGRLPLRLGAAYGTLVVPRAAELWVDQRSSWQPPELKAQSYIALLQGDAELWRSNGDSLARGILGAGQPLPSTNGRLRLALIGTRDRAQRESAEYLGKGVGQRLPNDAGARLERVLAAAEDAHEHSAALRGKILSAAAHRVTATAAPDAGYVPLAPKLSAAVVKPPVPSQVWAQQRELVESAQRRQGLHDLLLLAAEQSLFATLSACPSAQLATECAPLSAWRERFAARLGAQL